MSAARVAFLGTSAALTSAARDNTSLVFEAAGTALLADCGGGTLHRLQRLGVDPLGLTHVVVTHVHVDHAYGLPSLVRQLMLLGRRTPLAVVCRPEHVEPLRALLTTFRVWERPDAFALQLVPIDLAVGAPCVHQRNAPREHGPQRSRPDAELRRAGRGGGRRRRRLFVRHAAERQRGGAVPRSRHADPRGHVSRARPPAGSRRRPFERGRGRPGRDASRRRSVDPRPRRLAYHGDVEVLAAEARRHFAGEVRVAEELGSAYF